MKRKKINYIGETKMMNCGMEATIIEWFGNRNITVKFKDGTVIKNRQYIHFKKGNINNPNYKPHIGETKMMNCGMECEIIEWFNNINITVKFKDGTVIKNRRYIHFKNGKINNPNYKPYIGETKMMNCGVEATIIEWFDCKNITVKFKDGTIIREKQYSAFKKGGINNPNYHKHIGETKIMNCGMEATIIEWLDYNNITVKFKDETIVKNRRYTHFENGNINNPNYKPHIGETKMMNCGMECEIIEWLNNINITVKFIDGTVIKNRQYIDFEKGNINNLNYHKHIGETKMMNCGMECEIIEWFNNINITVKFKDGTVIKNRQYDNFKKGTINNFNIINVYDHLGKGFHTQIKMCEYWNIPYTTYYSRIRSQWLLKDALTVPKNMSLGEYKIKEALECRQIKYKYNKTLKTIFKEFKLDIPWEDFINVLYDDLKLKGITIWSKENIGKLKPDFVLYKNKNNKIIGIIEFDGKQHFGLIEYFFKTIQSFVYRCDCDAAKNKFFEFMSLPLLRIRYDQVDLIEPILDDFLAHPEEYVSKKHNPYLTEEEYWSELKNTFKEINDDDLGYNPS